MIMIDMQGSEARAQVMAVQDMGVGVGGGLLGGSLMASPSKRSRPQSAQVGRDAGGGGDEEGAGTELCLHWLLPFAHSLLTRVHIPPAHL